jgi:hypothetical protein
MNPLSRSDRANSIAHAVDLRPHEACDRGRRLAKLGVLLVTTGLDGVSDAVTQMLV